MQTESLEASVQGCSCYCWSNGQNHGQCSKCRVASSAISTILTFKEKYKKKRFSTHKINLTPPMTSVNSSVNGKIRLLVISKATFPTGATQIGMKLFVSAFGMSICSLLSSSSLIKNDGNCRFSNVHLILFD